MNGVLLTCIASIVLVLSDAGKKDLSLRHSTPVIVWNNLIVAILMNAALLFFMGRPFLISADSIGLIFGGVSALFLSELTFMAAMRSGEFSLSQPFKAFLPIIALPLGWFMLGEAPKPFAMIGVAICFGGAWLMFSTETTKGILGPFIAAAKVPASKWMLISGFFGALSACFQRLATATMDPLWFITAVFFLEWILFSVYLAKDRIHPLKVYRADPVTLIRTGILWGAGMSLFYLAIASAPILNVYVVAQLQPLFALLVARYLFREEAAFTRLFPTLLMICGVLVVIIVG